MQGYVAVDKIVTLKDVEKMSITALFSALGGILNLYSGISCVVIIEIFELMFLLIFRCNGPQKRNRIDSEPESDLAQKKPEPLFGFSGNYNTQWE